MPFKENDLQADPTKYTVNDPENLVTIDLVVKHLNHVLKSQLALPVRIEKDQISSGLFKKTLEDCVVVQNNDHKKDWFYFVITVTHQGVLTVVKKFATGRSKEQGNADFRTGANNARSRIEAEQGGIIGNALAARAKAKAEEKTARKLAPEREFYDYVDAALESLAK